MKNLLVVDDHQLFRLGLISLLKKVNCTTSIGEATTGIEAVQYARFHPVDLILMDLSMPEMGGLEATKNILLTNPKTNILILTAKTDDIFPFRLLRAGVKGYLTKNASSHELIDAFYKIIEGGTYLPLNLANKLATRSFNQDNIIQLLEGLSERELEMLLLLVKGKETIQISRELRLGISTVNCYRHKILKKVQVKNTVDLAHLAKAYRLID